MLLMPPGTFADQPSAPFACQRARRSRHRARGTARSRLAGFKLDWPADLTTAGVVALLGSGVYTLVFADLQYLGVRRIKR